MNDPTASKTVWIPFDLIQVGLRLWWVWVVGICLGGGLGYGLQSLFPPLYQAGAVITTGIDFSQTGQLTDVEEDIIIQAVGDIIESDPVIEATLLQANTHGITLDRPEFDEMNFLQRRFTDWLLVVRSRDPGQAALLANLWAGSAWSALSEATGLAQGTLVSLAQSAQIPDKPARYGRNTLVFAGAGLGFLVAWLVLLFISKKEPDGTLA